MSMISELVDRLRTESKSMGKYGVDYMATLLARSAGTIEMLSEKARADRPQGEWIDGKCSLCGKHAPYWAMATTYYKSNYCPSCGARMKGADDE